MMFGRLKNKKSLSLNTSTASSKQYKEGFTLIEIIVSIGIFSIVAFLSVSSLLVLLGGESHVESKRKLLNNISFAFEDIVRTARTGEKYRCSDELVYENDFGFNYELIPSSGLFCNYVAMETIDDGKYVVYRLNGTVLEKAEASSTTAVPDPAVSESDFRPLTSDRINVDDFSVDVLGADPDDGTQARIFVVMNATINHGTEDEQRIRLQTTATQRDVDF